MTLQLAALVLMGSAGAAAYMVKETYSKPHFVSTHSWIAGATSTLFTLNLLGVRLLLRKSLHTFALSLTRTLPCVVTGSRHDVRRQEDCVAMEEPGPPHRRRPHVRPRRHGVGLRRVQRHVGRLAARRRQAVHGRWAHRRGVRAAARQGRAHGRRQGASAEEARVGTALDLVRTVDSCLRHASHEHNNSSALLSIDESIASIPSIHLLTLARSPVVTAP